MAKKSPAKKAAETRKKKKPTLADVDAHLKRAQQWLVKNPPDLPSAKRAITNARKELRKACSLPPLK